MGYLTDLLSGPQKHDEAVQLARRILEIRRRMHGGEHREVAEAIGNLVNVFYLQGDYAAAEPPCREALAMLRKLLGNDHPDLAPWLVRLGRVLVKRGDSESAEPLLRKALNLRRQELAEDDWRVAVAGSALGDCLTRLGRYDEAESLVVESYLRLKAAQGDRALTTIQALRGIITLYESWGKPEQAAEWRAKLPTTQPAKAE
jgi:tetratricopeptide (TPR) repeat protein